MRLLLVLVLVHGLAPGLSAVGETVVHWARAGQAAEGAAADGECDCDCGDRGAEHGCGATQHHCACCATQVLVPIAVAGVAPLAAGRARASAPRAERLAAREQARPFRPPIS